MKLGFSVLLFLFGFKAFADFNFHAGHYEMQLKVGEKVFHDLVDIKVEADSDFRKSKLSGVLTVPGVFTSPLTGSSQYIPWNFAHYFSFEITAVENGQSYKVFYTGELKDDFMVNTPKTMTGEARLEDKSLLGTFIAVLKNE
jgi:hypothetical protein